jgi:predicted PhzF superfamily epimerase YddE/YHI9
MFVVDAFTARAFHGNPAAVVLCPTSFPPEAYMQALAGENNLSETAFVVPGRGAIKLRWFSPCVEVDLCGHATLAAAHVLWQHVGLDATRLMFATKGGKLAVTRADDLYELDLPAKPGRPVSVTRAMSEAVGSEIVEAYLADDLMLVLDSKRLVHGCRPSVEGLKGLAGRGVIVTAPGSGHDFVCRAFYPKLGVNEDPVTGSAHCTLVPYWSSVLGKARLWSHQVSWRGGELWCELLGDRVRMAGHAVTVSESRVLV